MLRIFLITILCAAHCAYAANSPSIMVSIKPFYNITCSVMQNVGEPKLLLKGNSSPHDYHLRPSEAQLISESDLMIWGGGNIESYLQKSIDSMAKANLDLSKIPGLKLLPLRADQNWQHTCGHDHDHSDCGYDPHFWLDPENAIIIATAIAEELAEIDPPNAKQYRSNAQNFAQQIRKNETAWKKQLKPYQHDAYIVGHDAFQYFNAYFDLDGVGSITLNPELPPSVKHIQYLQNLLAQEHVTCIFGEPQFSNKMAETLISGTTIKTGTLDPLGQDQDLGSQGYFVLMDNIVKNFVECNKDQTQNPKNTQAPK